MRPDLSPSTLAVVAGRPAPGPDEPLSPPVVLTSTYHAGGPRGYGRYGNPTWEALEEALGLLEGGRALSYASGMAAVSAVLGTLPVAASVVAPRHAYSQTLVQLDALAGKGVLSVRRVDVADTPAVAAAVRGAALLWLESPTNPMLEVADIPACAQAAHEAGAVVVVDNTFATPLGQRPLDLGADVVVHSVTKYLSGHSDLLLGAAVTRSDELYEGLLAARSGGGAVPGPVEAWLALRGLRTLHLRVERATHNAGVLAPRLAAHPAIQRVRYPGLPTDPGHERAAAAMHGFGAMIAVELADAAAADAFTGSVRLWVHATSLGGVESLLERRRRWPAEPPSVPEGLVRLSVGVEDVEDLWADLVIALPDG